MCYIGKGLAADIQQTFGSIHSTYHRILTLVLNFCAKNFDNWKFFFDEFL